MLEAEYLHLHHPEGGRNRPVCENMSFSVGKGTCVVITGATGSGKSTLIMALTGNLKPQQGHILLDGRDLYRLSKKDHRQFLERSGMVFQQSSLRPLDTVKKALRVHLPEGSADEEVQEILQTFQLADRERGLIRHLSPGQQRIIDVSRSLVHRPSLLVWDEPFAGLDDRVKNHFLDALSTLRERDTTMIFASSQPQDFEVLRPDAFLSL